MESRQEFKDAVLAANQRIAGHVRRTPLEHSHVLSQRCAGNVHLKLENEQVTGSFKARGAFNKLLLLQQTAGHKQFYTASSGNHGLACSHAGPKLGITPTVYVSTTVLSIKKQAMQAMGTRVVVHGHDGVDAEMKAHADALENGVPFVSPYNDLDVMHGQGTIGLEILEDCKDVDVVLVPVGGGGLISGIATYLKAMNPEIKIVGCSAQRTKVMHESVRANHVVFEESHDTLASGLSGGVEEPSLTFPHCVRDVDQWELVEEEHVEQGIYFMIKHHHKIVEGAAAVALGHLLASGEKYSGQTIAVVCTGLNISVDDVHKIIAKYKDSDII